MCIAHIRSKQSFLEGIFKGIDSLGQPEVRKKSIENHFVF